ncbi:hypothetical protein U1Q18_026188 [Sarracenia purpurea var. burkii]
MCGKGKELSEPLALTSHGQPSNDVPNYSLTPVALDLRLRLASTTIHCPCAIIQLLPSTTGVSPILQRALMLRATTCRPMCHRRPPRRTTRPPPCQRHCPVTPSTIAATLPCFVPSRTRHDMW